MNNMVNVVGALIIRDKYLLLAKRIKGELKDKWEFPGGKIEQGESEFDAIEREIYEELNINVVAVQKISTFHHKYPFADISLSLIKCKYSEGRSQLILKGSHSKINWFTFNDEIDLAPLDAKIFRYLKRLYVL